jgi:hypothetical protein
MTNFCYTRRYVYSGRGWKLLRVLDILLSADSRDKKGDLPFLPDDESKEFVDLLISLYQVMQYFLFRPTMHYVGQIDPYIRRLSAFSVSSLIRWIEDTPGRRQIH